MVERQDIDALLVGALYGELTPADQARLATHLDSHPGDRSALDGLKLARDAVRESQVLELRLDPPHAVSALLLQEAARRAPRPDGWFARFARSFAAHPAMAAAAMFVVVLGVAGTLYMKHGDQSVDQVASRSATPGTAPTSQTAEADPPASPALERAKDPTAAVNGGGAAAGSSSATGYTVALDEQAQGLTSRDRGLQPPKPARPPAPSGAPADTESATTGAGRGEGSIEVHTADRLPKELPDLAKGSYGSALAEGHRHSAAPVAATVPPAAHAATQPEPAPDLAGNFEPAKNAKTDDNTDATVQWARSQHQLLTAAVKSGKCQDAGALAVTIRNRAPDYYNSYVAPDRSLKPCTQYINDAAEKDAERGAKSRAKRSDASDVR